MAIVTERIPILVTAQEKARIAREAEAAGMSMAEYLRRAAAAYDPAQDARQFDAIAEQIARAASRRRLRRSPGKAGRPPLGTAPRAQAPHRRSLSMGVTEKLWDALTTVIKMFQSTPVTGRNSLEEVTPLPSTIIPLKGEVSNRVCFR